MNNINKLIKLKEKLIQDKEDQEKLFDNSNSLIDKKIYLDNINNLHIKLGQLQVRIDKLKGTYEEEEDYIKHPYALKGDCAFGGYLFRPAQEEEY